MVHHQDRRSARWLGIAVACGLGLIAGAPRSEAQVPPILDTTTTTAPATTTTTASTPTTAAPQPSGSALASGAAQAPAGAEDAGGDGASAPSGGIRVPPEAQRIINSVRRTGPSDNSQLLADLGQLEALGLPQPEAYRVGLGRFPIAGAAHYAHDWLYPRYGPGFRFHLGCDVFAAYGTPVRAPVDGVARSATSGLGGLTVKVVMPDGTYFYLAHLSALVDGFTDGMPVATGDIVGYVGDSGNARGGAPHLHIGIYPRGGAPVDPKPILDGFLAEAEGRLPEVLAAVQASRPPVTPAGGQQISVSEEQRALRPMLATEVLHLWADGGAALPQEVIFAAGANPQVGPRALVRLALDDLAAGIDWSQRGAATAQP
jgi:murein DD-endopeptidase MepM/ murein hydrolase activator NlpD